MQRFWDEIRRRNLHRVTAAYAVVAWVLVQAAGLVFPAFDLPPWALRLVIVLLVAGLPVVWVALWVAHPALQSAETSSKLHRTEWILITLMVLVLITSAGELAHSHLNGGNVTASSDPARAASIAVLAFENMSDDPKNEFFSEGISEELLNDLSQIRGLRVAGRTSSFSFRGKKVGIPEIGKALNVRTVLEGSVRREGARVRITAQLIDASDDYHIWSQTYDRRISDIFSVQDEISLAITRELTGRLLGKAMSAPRRSAQIDPTAYTAYLKGRSFLNKRNSDAMASAVVSFSEAIAREPNYADAHASLALAYALMIGNGQRRDTLEAAQREAAIATRLAPDRFDAMLANAVVQQSSWNWAEAYKAYSRLLARFRGNADAHHFYGHFMMNLYLPQRWLSEHRQAASLDPLSALDVENVGEALHALGHNDEAIAEFKKALALDPNLVFTLSQLCVAYADKGVLEDALKILDGQLTALDAGGDYTMLCRAAIDRGKPDANKTLRVLAQTAARGYLAGKVSAGIVGLIEAYAGDTDSAVLWFRKSVDNRETKFFQNTIGNLLPAAMSRDSRWTTIRSGSNFEEWKRIRIATALARSGGS